MRKAYFFAMSAICMLSSGPAWAESMASFQGSSEAGTEQSSQAQTQEGSEASSQESSQASTQQSSQSFTRASTEARPATPPNLVGDPLWRGGYGYWYPWGNYYGNPSPWTTPSLPPNGWGNNIYGNGNQHHVGNSGFRTAPKPVHFRAEESYGHLPERRGYKRFNNLGLGMPTHWAKVNHNRPGPEIIDNNGRAADVPHILAYPSNLPPPKPYTLRYSNPFDWKRSRPEGPASRLAEHRNGARM